MLNRCQLSIEFYTTMLKMKAVRYKLLTNTRLNHTWYKPEGYDTGIQVYNCVKKEKVPFIIRNKNIVNWYTCGPTVYDSAHVGHASCYMKVDILQRILKSYFNVRVIHVMNITDIDDKILKQSETENVSSISLAKKYEDEFWSEIDSLCITRPNMVLRVTENIELIKKFISTLFKKGFAYKANDNSVYFDVSKLNSYGKLQNIVIEEGDHGTKKSLADFALWKAVKPGEIFWNSDWGPGRPGWHIECSALAGTLFGSEIDVHAGGIDLRFPHHENEEAQSCTYFDKKQWVNYWFHIGHVHLRDSEKMSKSLKNTVRIKDLLKKTNPNVFRYACMMSHYRNAMEYSDDLLVTAENSLNKFSFLINDCKEFLKGRIKGCINNDIINASVNKTYEDIVTALVNDFDTASVIKALNGLAKLTNKMLHSSGTSTINNNISNSYALLTVIDLIENTLSNFGIDVSTTVKNEENEMNNIMNILNDFRQNVRLLSIEKKDKQILKICDNVRSELKKYGVTINDYGKHSSWIK